MKTLNLLLKRSKKVPVLMVLFSLVLTACASPAAANQAVATVPVVAAATTASDYNLYTPAAISPSAAPTQAAVVPTASVVTTVTAAPSGAPVTAPDPAATTPSNSVQAVKLDSNKMFGLLLVTTDGRTFYTFGKDTPRVSNCTASQCVAFWPPYVVSGMPAAIKGLPGTLSTITRADGTAQLAYNDMPLYTFTIDKKPGAVNGDGLNDFGGIWHVVVIAAPQSKVSKKPPKTSGGGYRPVPMYP
jgi:predicted lipoprotein with Yx(FWY)xxD motif